MKYSFKNTRKPVLIIFYLLFSIFLVLIVLSIRNINYNIWIRWFCIIILIQFVFQYLIFRQFDFNFISLSGFFLVFSYLFHFGQILIAGLFPTYQLQHFNYIKVLNPDTIQRAAMFSLFVIIMVEFGMLIFMRKGKTNYVYNCKKSDMDKCKSIGWMLVVITFPIYLYLDVDKLIMSANYGYLATYKRGIPGVFSAIGFLSFSGFGLLILGYSKEKKKSLILFVLVVIYLILSMFSGHRGHQLTILIFLIYILHKAVYRINFIQLIIIGLMGFFFSAFLNTIFLFRGLEGKNFSMFFEFFIYNLHNVNPILELIGEMGGTIRTPYLVMQQIPSDKPYAYGMTYLMSIFSILPDIGDIFSEINTYACFTKNLAGHALGGSYIGELYYNFSYFGIFFAIFVGLFVNYISQKIEDLLKEKNYFKVGYYTSLFIYLLWWPRDTFQSILRPTVWGVAILYMIENVYLKVKYSHALYSKQKVQK